eukprot:gnl/MRDRNA2_/MRDRNA2_29666_c0_seq1.p1 gnl/MRDRNA2_/MRDRNA2_29666_c0~~gnl/MRDRNA2_/MRDRNA2_29666_c0_seq1.p1  ORF type:complete len:285 (-),score=44.13 gnl/MRDRNA2_/MRDRNA2_29666_c0_seq1:31-885(-)
MHIFEWHLLFLVLVATGVSSIQKLRGFSIKDFSLKDFATNVSTTEAMMHGNISNEVEVQDELGPRDWEFRNYVHQCETGSDAWNAIWRMDMGNSTAYHNDRAHFVYMRSTYCALKYVGPNARNIVDVGSSWPPFLRAVDWVQDEERTIVSKYFPGDGGSDMRCSGGHKECTDERSGIHVVMRDFYEWKPPHSYDLVLCSQVLEHVPNPVSFMQKLLTTGQTVVVTVPYRWPDYDMHFHKQHNIFLKDVRRWAKKQEMFYYISEESDKGAYSRRLLAVFKGTVNA